MCDQRVRIHPWRRVDHLRVVNGAGGVPQLKNTVKQLVRWHKGYGVGDDWMLSGA